MNQAPAITSASFVPLTIGQGSTFIVTTTGFPTAALSLSGVLPAGMTFLDRGDGTATLSGTPAAGTGGTYVITVSASNGVGATPITQAITISVGQPPVLTNATATTFTVGKKGTFLFDQRQFPALGTTLT